MLSTSDIRPYVEAVLRLADNSLSSYQILERLPAGIRDQIVAERGMPGLGSGNPYSAASFVTDAVESLLPSKEPPYRVYVDTGNATFQVAGQTIQAGNAAIAFYRLNLPPSSNLLVSENKTQAVATAEKPTPAQVTSQPANKAWFEKPGMLVLWFVLFWPVFLVGMYYNGKAAIAQRRTPWYEETPWLVLSAFFFPLFFVGLFSNRKISPKWKWTVAGSFGVLYAAFALTYHPDEVASVPAAVHIHKDAPISPSSAPKLDLDGPDTGVATTSHDNSYDGGVQPSETAVATPESVSSPSFESPSAGEEGDAAAGIYTVKSGVWVGATSRGALDRYTDDVVSKDSAAQQQLIDSGEVFQLKSGTRVQLLANEGFLGSVKRVRPLGTNDEIYTVMEALDRPTR